MKLKLCAVLAVVGVLLLAAGSADALPAHYSDGTTFQGAINFGPPPVAPRWEEECKILVVDPTVYTWVTQHFDFNDDGTEDAYLVLPFVRDPATNELNVDVSSIVDGHAGVTWTTWNIGTGQGTKVPFDCTTPATTTTSTTVAPTTSTTEPATTTTISGEGSTTTEPATTTTISGEGSTVPGQSTTTTVAASGSTTPTSEDGSTTASTTLPFTGGNTGVLSFGAVVLLASGGLLATRKRRKRN